jgi:hypothetical protein
MVLPVRWTPLQAISAQQCELATAFASRDTKPTLFLFLPQAMHDQFLCYSMACDSILILRIGGTGTIRAESFFPLTSKLSGVVFSPALSADEMNSDLLETLWAHALRLRRNKIENSAANYIRHCLQRDPLLAILTPREDTTSRRS